VRQRGRSVLKSTIGAFSTSFRATRFCCAQSTLLQSSKIARQLSLRPLIDWLDYNGYTVITKVAKEFTDADGRRKVRGNIGVELAVHALELAKHVDQMVLFSGDADFRRLVQALQRRGVRVTVISNISSEPPMIGSDLRRQADVFIDLAEMRSKLGRNRI